MSFLDIKIFVDSAESPEILIQKIEAALGLKFTPVLEEDEYYDSAWFFYKYVGEADINKTLCLTMGIHEFENDRDLLFEKYKYVVGVRVSADNNTLTRAVSLEYARGVFEKLRATHAYRLMMVNDDLNAKLDQFDPVFPA